MIRHTPSILLVGLLAAASACGSDETPNATGNPTTSAATAAPATTAEGFRAAANAICVEGNAEIGAIIGDLFAPGEPDPAQMQPALDAILAVSRTQLDGVAALSAPADLEADVDAMLTEFERAITEAEATPGPAYFGRDEDPFAATQAMAADLGLDDCAGESE